MPQTTVKTILASVPEILKRATIQNVLILGIRRERLEKRRSLQLCFAGENYLRYPLTKSGRYLY